MLRAPVKRIADEIVAFDSARTPNGSMNSRRDLWFLGGGGAA